MIEQVAAPDAPAPGGHYAQATSWNGFVFVSGQLPIRPSGEHLADATFEAQARQAISNLLSISRAAGCDPGRVLKVTAYVVGVENWPVFNNVFAELFGDARPARAVVPVPALHYGYLIEVEAIAALPEHQRS